MAVRFILGRSGTGKTSFCIKAITESLLEGSDGRPLVFLVPEQATYQAERAILSDGRVAGYSRLHVLSFDRLQFLLLGSKTARPALSRIGQQMIIHRILRENKDRLKVLGTSADWPGLSRRIAETITEIHQYAKGSEDIEQLLSELQKDRRYSLAALKFADIGLVFEEYHKFIEGRFVDPDVQLTRVCSLVADSDFIKGARLWVDGFAGFTTSELAVFAELLKAAADVQIALCLDPSNVDLAKADSESIDPVGLFSPTERTYAAVIELIRKCKCRLAEPVVLEKTVRFSGCRQLGHIERNLFEIEPAKIPAGNSVRIVSAPSTRAEVRYVARQILDLVKERGYRYRDIAVIASDIEGYQHYIKAYFDDYGIPFFLDRRKLLNQHPVVGLICSALQVVSGGFCHRDIFSYLKTGLVAIDSYEVDLLENYCVAFGMDGGDWQSGKQWGFAGDDDELFDQRRVNKVRVKVSGPLLELRDKLLGKKAGGGHPDDTRTKMVAAEEFTGIIFDFMESLGVRERISQWIEEAAEVSDYAAVDEHRQFYERLVDIFDELVEVFGGWQARYQDYFSIINSGFSQLTLAFIPQSLDQVLVGSIERSRHPDLKAVFLMGATQKQFPSPISYAGILTDEDRNAAESMDFQLAATTAEKLAERQYLAYIAFTRPSQLLCISYPLVDDRGRAVVCSQFIANLESLFEDVEEESVTDERIGVDTIHSGGELSELLCSKLGKEAAESKTGEENQLIELLNGVCQDTELGRLGATVWAAINYDNSAVLDTSVVGAVFGEQMRSSATRLGTFAACPYRHFARYVLALKERREFKLKPLDIGDFYHRVLDGLLKRLNKERKDFATVEKEELLEFLGDQIAELVSRDSFISNFVRHRFHNEFIIRCGCEALEHCVLAISEMVRAGQFKPSRSEVSFGQLVNDSRLGLGEFKLGLSDGRVLSLDGKIDRVDIAENNDEKIAIVFDYKKRRDESFSWSKFYYGLDMQLPIYMLAVRDLKSSNCKADEIAGAFYMPVEVSPKTTALDELPGKAETFSYKAKGIFNGQFAEQLDRNASQNSKFYNFHVTKDGQPYGSYSNRGALRPGDFEKVLRFTERKIIQLAEEILSGEIDIRPYRLSQNCPCSYCEYRPVCRFDWQINEYNFLVSVGKSDVLKVLEGVDG